MVACIALSSSAFADQLMGLNLRQAKIATQFLLKQNQIILFCSCCDQATEKPIGVTLTDVWYKEWKTKGFEGIYSVYVSGYTVLSHGKLDTFKLDLAYVYYNYNGNARCVGTALFKESDGAKIGPCNQREYFTWDKRFFYNSYNPVYYDKKEIPSIYSDFVIQNNRKEPFSVYLNGVHVGRVSGYGELILKGQIAHSPSVIKVIQESGYVFYPSEYTYTFNEVQWGKKYTWKFQR